MPQKEKFPVKFKRYCGFEWPGWWRVLFWASAALLLTGIAIKDFLAILDEYQNNNSATQINVIIKNETLRRPELALCIPYYSGALENVGRWVKKHMGEIMQGQSPSTDDCIECEAMKNHSWDIWSNMSFQPRLMFAGGPAGVMTELIMKRLVNEDLEALIFDTTDTQYQYVFWNQPIVDAAWLFISCHYARDHFFARNGEAMMAYCRNFNPQRIGFVSDEKFREIFNYTVSTVDIFMSTQVSVPGDSKSGGYAITVSPPVQERKGFTPLAEKFCFNMLAQSTREEYPFYTYHAMYRPNLPPWKRSDRLGRFEIYDLTTTSSFIDEDRALFKTNETKLKELDWNVVTLSYSIENLVSEERTEVECSRDRIPSDCLQKRVVEHAITTCRCVPFAFRNYALASVGALPYCNATLYEECTEKIGGWEAEADLLDSHRRACDIKCEYIFYKWKIIHRAIASDTFLFNVALQPDIRPFIHFILTTKSTFEQFLAQVGGVFGIYLGVSGLTAFALIVLVVDTLQRLRQRNEEEEAVASSNRRDSMAALRWFWVTKMVHAAQNDTGGSEAAGQNANLQLQELRDQMEIKLTDMTEQIDRMKSVLDGLCEKMSEIDLKGRGMIRSTSDEL